MAALLLLAGVHIVLAGILIPRLFLNSWQPGTLSSFLGYGSLVWMRVDNIFSVLMTLTGLATALSAASACLKFSAKVVESFPDPLANSRHGLLFLCSLRQAIWPLSIIGLVDCGVFDGLLSGYLYIRVLAPTWQPAWVFDQIPSNIPWAIAIFAIWLIALLTAARPCFGFAWVWLVLIYLISISYSLLLASNFSASVISWGFQSNSAVSANLPHFGWLVGALLMIPLVRVSLKQYRGWMYLIRTVVLISSVMYVVSFRFPNSELPKDPELYSEILSTHQRAGIEVIVDSLREASYFYYSDPASCEVRSSTDKLPIKYGDLGAFVTSPIPVVWSVQVAPWVKYPLVAVNAAYLALVIWFIACVLLRQRAGPATLV